MATLPGIAVSLLRPATEAVGLGVRTERRVRGAVSRSAGEAAVEVLQAVLASPAAEVAVDRILESPLLERALAQAMRGSLVEAVARDLSRYEVVERATEQMLAGDALERITDRALQSPHAEQLVARMVESTLLEDAVARLLETEYLWLLVDEVARSSSVTAAISHQGVGFAEEMAGVVRDRSHTADARWERRARRIFHRERADGHE